MLQERWISMAKVKVKECRYCDTGFPMSIGGDVTICSGCGAEWDPVEVEYDESEFDDD